jgi:hypothetical protein
MTAWLGITSPPDGTTTADYGHTIPELPAIAAAITRSRSRAMLTRLLSGQLSDYASDAGF